MPKQSYKGTITGPDEAPALGASLTFHVTGLAGFAPKVKPYLYAQAYQDGELVYGELKLVEGPNVNFPKFGFDSQWSEQGGPAECTVSLVAYAGIGKGGTIAWIDSVNFKAEA